MLYPIELRLVGQSTLLCDRPDPGGDPDLFFTSREAYARGPLLRGGIRMDYQCDSGGIKPLEATAL